MPAHSLLSVLGLSVCVVGLAGQCAAQPERNWRETMQVDAPLLAAKRLENVRGLLEQEEWDAALETLAELEQEFPDALVSWSTGRYVSVRLAARLLRLHLPAEGLDVYRRQIDGWAGQQLETAEKLQNPDLLDRVVETALPSGFGDEALSRLAENAWERGDIAEARRFWTMMIPLEVASPEMMVVRYPDTDLDLAAIYARLVLCSLAAGEVERARTESAAFREMFPEAEGFLAGRQGRLSATLDSLVSEAVEWSPLRPPADWTTFARRHTRNSATSIPVRIGAPVWSLPLPPVYVPRWERPRPALPERGLLSRFPVTFGDGVFLHDGTTVLGIRLENGKPLWPVENNAASGETPGKIYPPFPAIPNSLPWTPVVGLPRQTATIHSGRFYALMGPSVLTLPPGGHQASPTRLVCIDLAEGEGILRWFQTPEDVFGDDWLMTGSPVAEGDRLYLPLVRSAPQIELAVACLDAGDGSLVWLQTIGQALREPLGGRVELGHQLLTRAADRLFFATDFGGIGCLDTQTGALRWVVTYPVRDVLPVERSDESSIGLMPPLYYDGLIFVKPNDGDEMMAIDAESGRIIWRRRPPGRIVHLLGATGSSLLVSGDRLWSLDVDSGQPQWVFGYDDVAGYGYGRGAVVGDRVVWPLRDELIVVETGTGRLCDRVPLRSALGVSGGHLLIDGNRLLITGRDHLTAFEVRAESSPR